jgi:hypothetical protein
LTETYGYPVWAVLTLFVIITISLGLLLGVLLIVLLDCFCAPKKRIDDDYKHFKEEDIADENDETVRKNAIDKSSSTDDEAKSAKEKKTSKQKAKKDN